MEANFRAARADDLPAIMPMMRQLWAMLTSDDLKRLDDGIRSALHQQGSARKFYVAELEGRVVGFATLGLATDLWHVAFHGAHIDEFVVDESCRGQGLGKSFLAFVLDQARQHGVKVVELTSAGYRTRAHHFYLREGFVLRETRMFGKTLE